MIVASYWAMQLSLCDIFFHATVQSQKLWWKRPFTAVNLGIVLSNTVQQRLTNFLLVWKHFFFVQFPKKISTKCWRPKLTQKLPIENPFPFLLQAVDVLINSLNDTEKVTAISASQPHTNGIYGIIFWCSWDVILVIHRLIADVSGIH